MSRAFRTAPYSYVAVHVLIHTLPANPCTTGVVRLTHIQINKEARTFSCVNRSRSFLQLLSMLRTSLLLRTSVRAAPARVFSTGRKTATRFPGATLTAVGAGVAAGFFYPSSHSASSTTDRIQEAEARLQALELKALESNAAVTSNGSTVLATSAAPSGGWPQTGGPMNGTYRRTLRFALSVAAEQAIPSRKLVGGFAVGDGYVFSFTDGKGISQQELVAINTALVKLVASDVPITPVDLPWLEVSTARSHHTSLRNTALSRSVVQSHSRSTARECAAQPNWRC